MSTRGFVGFVVDGTEKIAYNHSDSYPEGLGKDVLSWLRLGFDIEFLRIAARTLRVVTDETPITDEDILRLRPFTDRNVGERKERPDWYQLLRHTQGKPGEMLRAGVIQNAAEFPLSSLFAEWGYLVDLDAGTLEVYRGFQKSSSIKGRFAGRPGQDGYYPCALIKSWPLSALPDDEAFIVALQGDES